MKRLIIAAAVLFAAPFAPASAQQAGAPGAAATEVYNWCLTLETGSVSECSCVAGFYAGATDADEFQIFAASLRFSNANGEVADIPGLQAALAARKAELGLTDARFNAIIAGFRAYDKLGEKADSICMPIETRVGDAGEGR